MPFEPAPKESPAARLAALIELGRIANPDIKQSMKGNAWIENDATCAMGFAALGAGRAREALQDVEGSANAMNVELRDFRSLYYWVAETNDSGASLDEICLSLREGELAKVTA